MRAADIQDNHVEEGAIDVRWLEWWEAHLAHRQLCRERSPRWSCTLLRGHVGGHVAHMENTGKVIERWGIPLPDVWKVVEGL